MVQSAGPTRIIFFHFYMPIPLGAFPWFCGPANTRGSTDRLAGTFPDLFLAGCVSAGRHYSPFSSLLTCLQLPIDEGPSGPVRFGPGDCPRSGPAPHREKYRGCCQRNDRARGRGVPFSSPAHDGSRSGERGRLRRPARLLRRERLRRRAERSVPWACVSSCGGPLHYASAGSS